MNSEVSPAQSRRSAVSFLPRAGAGLLSAWLIFAGLCYAVSTLLLVANFAWPQPAFDQLRLYTLYLGLPFPQNVLVLENGHRPIVPALLRVLEIEAFSANQYLQIAVGIAFASLTALILAMVAWRDRSLDMPSRAAGLSLSLIAIFWLGNARMLLHGNELVHAYLVMLCLVGGALMVRRAALDGGTWWMLGAALAAITATFSFGPGIALFPTFFVLAWLQRASGRHFVTLGAAAAVCLILYLIVLPGDGGVRASLSLRPIDSLIAAARWLASPWITGWLGLADPQTHQIAADGGLGLLLKGSANALQAALGMQWATTGAALLGAAGMLVLLAVLAVKARRRHSLSPLQTLALALMMFGAATAAIIGIGRVAYFDRAPEQVFADRYLLWTCLFWLGLNLQLLSMTATRRPWVRNGMLVFAALLPLVLMPFHRYGQGWGMAVYRSNQASAAAAMSNVFDEQRFATGDDASSEQRVQAYRLMRERHLGPFRVPGSDQLGNTVDHVVTSGAVSATMSRPVAVRDVRDGFAAGARFDGVVVSGIKAIQSRGPLVIIDANRKIVGYAMLSHVGKPRALLDSPFPRKRGFDGYVKDYDPTTSYRVVSLGLDGLQDAAWDLGQLASIAP